MSIKKKSSSSTLTELRALVDNLTDRDLRIKRDFRLFEDFFDHFPVPVSMWSSLTNGNIISVKDKGFFCKEAKTIDDLVECEETKTVILEGHKNAISGKNFQDIVVTESRCHYVAIVGKKDEKEEVIGVSGIAWDVSSNFFILDTLEKIKNLSDDNSGTLEEVASLADTAIKKSRLFKLLKGE